VKILFYNHTAQVSGAERVLLLILARLDRSRFDPVLLCPAGALSKLATEAEVLCETVGQLEARFTRRPDLLLRYLISFARTMRETRARVREINPDLIHANSIRAGIVMTIATAGLRMPVIWHLHDMLPRHPLSAIVRLCAAASRRTRLIAVAQAVAACFQSQFSRLLSRVPLKVLRNAVEWEKYPTNGFRDRRIRRGLGLTGSEPVIGIIGQLTPRKGQLELLDAFAEVATKIPNAALLVVGGPLFNRDGDYQSLLKQRAAELRLDRRVHFLGQRPDAASIMQALDLLVVNSKEDPFPLVVLEGLASGTPIVATAVGGIPEMITHRESGWLVQSGNDRELAAAIISLITRPELRKQLADKGRRDVQTRFSVSTFMKELEDFYAESSTDFSLCAAAAEPLERRNHSISAA
jgi:L-malate glycosyltransferase